MGFRRLLPLFLVSAGICGVLGPLLGPVLMGLLAGAATLPLAPDNSGLPFYLFSLRAVGPFGVAAGIVGALICLALLKLGVGRRGFTAYILIVAMFGMVLGSAVPLYFHLTGRGGFERDWLLVVAAVLTGGTCAVAVGGFVWHEMRE